MSLVLLTRPDGSPVAINPDEIVHLAPVPATGPLSTGTRIVFRNQSHQDVKELIDVVVAKINEARTLLASVSARPSANAATVAGPTFSDVVKLLETLVNADPNIAAAPHMAFWRNVSQVQFLAIQTDNWGLGGPLVVPGNADSSPLYQALSGASPFDGSGFLQQMPDTSRWPQARYATPQELVMVKSWIQGLPSA